jgi:hypothetical protein
MLRRMDVRPAERLIFGWGSACLVLLGAAAFALLNTAETLFLKRVGVESMPLALLASAALLVLTTAWAGTIASKDPPRWLPRILALIALAPLPFAPFIEGQAPAVFACLVLVARQVLAVGMLVFWLAMGSLVPTRRAKQLFAPLAAGVTVGGIVGSFGSEPLARWAGLDGLIVLCSVVLGGAAAASTRLIHRGTRQLDRGLASPTVTTPVAQASPVAVFRTSRLFRLLAVALFCGGALSPVLYFQFTSVLDAATTGPEAEQQLLGLYSQFRGWVNVALLAGQLWLTARLYRNVGLPLSLALWPAVYVLGFAWLGLDFSLLVAFATFGAVRVAEESVADPAQRVLYSLFPDGIRARASGWLEGPIYRLGGASGNGFVLAALALGGGAWVGWGALPVAGIWLASALLLWRVYPGLLLQASAEHGLAGADVDRASLLDAATLRSLADHLVDPDPGVCRAALDLLVDGERARVVALIAGAVESAPPGNRPLLAQALRQLVESSAPESARSDAAMQSLARALRAQPPLLPELREDLLRAYARLTSDLASDDPRSEASKALLDRALGDRAAPVRLVAVAELHRRAAPPPGLRDLDRLLSDALSASDALLRRAARQELRSILLSTLPDARWHERLGVLVHHLEQRADRVETANALRAVARRHGSAAKAAASSALRYVGDRDAEVRGPLLAIAGHAGLAEEGARMVSALGARERSEAEGAREGLVALGPAAALPLLVGMEFGGPLRRDAILSVLRELEVDAAILEALRVRQLGAIYEMLLLRAAMERLSGPPAFLLQRRLDERVGEGLGAMLCLLAASHEEPRLTQLEGRLRRAEPGHQRDLVIEAIEALLGRGERLVIVPLLEPGDRATELAVTAMGHPVPDAEAAVAELRRSPDETTRRLADAIRLEGSDAIGDAVPMPLAMDIAVRLQEVPAFARLGTPQLLQLAGLLQEQKLTPGERIYGVGEEGLSLYFVLDGEVELRRGDLVLERVGAGSIFGELSTVDGLPRSADAVASTAVRLFRLEREDLVPLLDETPGLAVGLAQLLSSRVRRLEERLEQTLAATGEGG